MNSIQAMAKLFRRFLSWVWYARNSIPLLNFPIPWRLPYGGWFLVYPDEMGLGLIPKRPWNKLSSSYEEGEWRFLLRFIKQGMVCFDIGANQGFYTILLSKQVGTQGKVFAFEPVPGELRKLKRNIRINRCSNVVLEGMAISSYEGYVDMFVCLGGHSSRSSLAPPPTEVKAPVKVEKVPVITLDGYIMRNDIKEIHFMKIDVEGSEREVIKGAEKVVLKELRPLIMMEMADVTNLQFGYKAVENYRYLDSLGFVWFEVTSNGFLKTTSPKITYRENLIAVPEEKLKMVQRFIKE